MDEYAVEVLELEKILTEVKKQAQTKIGKNIIDKLKPVSKLSYVRKRLKEVTASRDLMDQFGRPPFGGINDLRKILKKEKL